MNLFKYSNTNKRYYQLDYYNKNHFGQKVYKVSLNGGFTCPNKDGKKGFGGCVFCSKKGSGDFAGNPTLSLTEQFLQIKEVIDKKASNIKYIGYFQANTNTYDTLNNLKSKYEEILKIANVVGLAIGTRPDSISDEVLNYLEELNGKTDLTIELGLQTSHEKTAQFINRGYKLEEFEKMIQKLRKKKIKVVVHLINGLPGESKEMMIENIKYLNELPIFGIKIHMLQVLKNTNLENIYKEKPFKLLTKEQYIDIVCDQIENLRENIVIERLTGDPSKENLIAPDWTLKKVDVLNGIDKELENRMTYQGFNRSILNHSKREILINCNKNKVAIDATCGNGNDTLFLTSFFKNKVYGFDIQEVAIKRTEKLLKEKGVTNYKLINDSHDNIEFHLKQNKGLVSLVIFNLGYLPNENKKITTKPKSTIRAIDQSYNLLSDKGIILITVYTGHDEGKIESKEILKHIEKYDYSIIKNSSKEYAPYLIKIKKRND